MNALLRRRLARLEQAISPAETVARMGGVGDAGEYHRAAVPEGVLDGVRVLQFSCRLARLNRAQFVGTGLREPVSE
jgi:hypothetical protein